jgi:hypothetical protein
MLLGGGALTVEDKPSEGDSSILDRAIFIYLPSKANDLASSYLDFFQGTSSSRPDMHHAEKM